MKVMFTQYKILFVEVQTLEKLVFVDITEGKANNYYLYKIIC